MIYQLVFGKGGVRKLVDAPNTEAVQVFLQQNNLDAKIVHVPTNEETIAALALTTQVLLNEQGGVEFGDIRESYIDWWGREAELVANPPNNIYEGVVEVETDWEVFVNDEPFDNHESLEICGHSPDGFAWGYGGSGVAQLALAMILNETGNPGLAQLRYIHFKDDVLANLPSDQGWKYTSDQLRKWLELAKEIDRGNDEILG